MKKLFLFCLSACMFCIASGQKVFFVYLQTDDQVPFYVRMADKIYSSAVSGFLILPNLVDSTYNLNIGFAKSTKPETRFAVTVNQNDKGYLVKNFENGLGLFDMQNLTLLQPASANNNIAYETRTDRFSSTLSKAADDPGLLKVPVVKKEEPIVVKSEEKFDIKPIQEQKTDNKEISRPDTLSVVKEDKSETQNTIKTDTVATQPFISPENKEPKKDENSVTEQLIEYKPSVIKRRSESSTTEGFGVIYFDSYEGITDTIRILIPPSKIKLSDVEGEPKEETKTIQIGSVTNDLIKINDSLQKESRENDGTKVNAVCKNIASEKDFMKVRKNMAAKENDDAMIEEARKAFRNKCFTVDQVRYLSTLFLTSAAKYQFFDAAYEHVVDKKDYSSLQSEIKDEYYLKRFKALVGE